MKNALTKICLEPELNGGGGADFSEPVWVTLGMDWPLSVWRCRLIINRLQSRKEKYLLRFRG